jgi:hypothetical protein
MRRFEIDLRPGGYFLMDSFGLNEILGALLARDYVPATAMGFAGLSHDSERPT